MNSTDNGSGFLSSGNIGGFGYGIGVSVGILLLITTITLASYFCTRVTPQQPHRNRNTEPDAVRIDVGGGIDEVTIKSYPKMLYSEAKVKKRDSAKDTCCSICLADYKNTDMLRVLPECDHLFHLKCIDPWLRLHPTCPLCRTSPLSTPLAEVVPLAAARV